MDSDQSHVQWFSQILSRHFERFSSMERMLLRALCLKDRPGPWTRFQGKEEKKSNHRFLANISTIGLRNDTAQTGQSFAPRCEERPECGSTSVQSDCLCSGRQMVAMVVLMMTRMTIKWYLPERQQWYHYERDDIWSKALLKMIKDWTDMIQSKLDIWHMFEVCGVLIIFKSWTRLPCLTIFHLAIMFLDGGGLWRAAVTYLTHWAFIIVAKLIDCLLLLSFVYCCWLSWKLFVLISVVEHASHAFRSEVIEEL